MIMVMADSVFATYESTIQGDGDDVAAEGFIPDIGIRLVVGWTAEGVPAWFAETDMVPGATGPTRDFGLMIDALERISEQLRAHTMGLLPLRTRDDGQ